MMKNKKGMSLKLAIFVIIALIAVILYAFLSEERKITGFAIRDVQLSLKEFDSVNSLSTLGVGYYFIDENGIVYWLDDESKPAIAKVNYVHESQKNRRIYIDNEGDIGYLIE